MGFFKDIGNFFAGGGLAGVITQAATGQNTKDIIADAATGGAVSNAKAVADTNQQQTGLANQQMGFQQYNSDTAYQRAVADMQKAGLNPSLAYQNGGASVPSGSMATLTAPRPGDIGSGLLNTAKSIATNSVGLKNTESQTRLNRANETVADVSAQKLTANAKESEENTRYTKQLAAKAKADTRAAEYDAEKKRLDVGVSKARRGIDEKLAPVDAIIERIGDVFGIGGTAFKNFTRGGGRKMSPYEKEQDRLHRSGSRGIPVRNRLP